MKPPPLAIRALNQIGFILQKIGLDPTRIEPEILETVAKKTTLLSDFGGDDYREGLEVLCNSALNDARLSFFGKMAFRRMVVQSLVTRLQLIQKVRSNPQIFSAALQSPIIVLGLPRSGTTFLHRLLSLDPASRALKLWEVVRPIQGKGKDKRRAQVKKDLKWLKRMAPDIDAKHFLDADAPEECLFLLNSSFKSLAFWVGQPVYSYLEWLRDQDLHQAYQLYSQHLKIFQSQTPDQRLVLKSPVHTGYLNELTAAIPNARIVFTHRDPIAVNASVNSLFRSLFQIVSNELDVFQMSRANLEMLTTAAERAVEARCNMSKGSYVDIQYPDLVSDPIGSVRKIYAHFELPLEADFLEHLKHYIAHRPQHHFGIHRYSLKEFGISEPEVHRRFSDYCQIAQPDTKSAQTIG